ncbi:hypothetical protein TOTORO_00470 [Serratia phage vB_SmaS-Totoro]|nr:hypothetical protein TOTORO_00470 [Serratia phage vB_SmaS-Totoro]
MSILQGDFDGDTIIGYYVRLAHKVKKGPGKGTSRRVVIFMRTMGVN